MSGMCCTQLAENTGCKNRHFGTIGQLYRAVSSQLRHVLTIKRNLLNTDTSSTCPHNMVNFGLLTAASPLPSNRHHRSSGDCLEGKGETVKSVLCSIVCNNCAQCSAHTYEQTNSSLDWVLSHWAHFTVLRFIFVLCITVLHACIGL